MTPDKTAPIYFDNQATTPVDARVVAEMLPLLDSQYGNAHSSDHWFGWQAKRAVDTARGKIGAMIKADADEIIFTSGATEANNLAIIGLLDYLLASGRTTIISSTIEHKCVLEALRVAETKGFNVLLLSPSSDGRIAPSLLARAMSDQVGLVSIMSVNNEIGTVQDINAFASIARQSGALFHTDAAQAPLAIDLDVVTIGIDLLSLSAHKMQGPKGIGALYVRRDLHVSLKPLIVGGGQEAGIRSGTLPTMLCVGFGRAAELAVIESREIREHLKSLSNRFQSRLIKLYPDAVVNGSTEHRHPGNLNITFPGVDAHSLLQAVQPYLAASTGSACTSGTPEPSYVLAALGLPREVAAATIRLSFGMRNTLDEVDWAIDLLISALTSLNEEPENYLSCALL